MLYELLTTIAHSKDCRLEFVAMYTKSVIDQGLVISQTLAAN